MKPKSDTCVICKDGYGDNSPANIVYEKRLETLIRVHEEKDATELLMSSGIKKQQSRSQDSSQL